MAKVGRPKKEDKRDIEIRFRVNEKENECIEELAKKLKMNKSRLIRNIVLGDLGEMQMITNIGLLPLVQNIKAFYSKNFKGDDYWEDIKKDN